MSNAKIPTPTHIQMPAPGAPLAPALAPLGTASVVEEVVAVLVTLLPAVLVEAALADAADEADDEDASAMRKLILPTISAHSMRVSLSYWRAMTRFLSR